MGPTLNDLKIPQPKGLGGCCTLTHPVIIFTNTIPSSTVFLRPENQLLRPLAVHKPRAASQAEIQPSENRNRLAAEGSGVRQELPLLRT